MNGIDVRAVRSRRERSVFVNLPWTLYRDDGCWVPPLKRSVRELIDPDRHPFYGGGREAELELFLAWEGRIPVGRVAAIRNHAHDRFHDESTGFFGFFETIDRPDVAAGLLAAAQDWIGARGGRTIRGPMNPSTNYECGLLVEGFNRPPVLMMTYNPPFYERLIVGAGFRKVKDLYAYISPVHGPQLDRMRRLADRSRERVPGLTTRAANLKDFHGEVRLVQEIYNSAWERNWGFVPMNDGEIEWLARELKPLVQPDLLRFASVDGDPAGFILTIPDWNPVLADFDGSLLRHPFRTVKHLLTTRAERLEGLRLITLGVKERYRRRGIEGVLMTESLSAALDVGYRWAEYSWILEDNELTKRAVRLMDGELYKVYRVFEKPL